LEDPRNLQKEEPSILICGRFLNHMNLIHSPKFNLICLIHITNLNINSKLNAFINITILKYRTVMNLGNSITFQIEIPLAQHPQHAGHDHDAPAPCAGGVEAGWGGVGDRDSQPGSSSSPSHISPMGRRRRRLCTTQPPSSPAHWRSRRWKCMGTCCNKKHSLLEKFSAIN
jgi:hypothetical protein